MFAFHQFLTLLVIVAPGESGEKRKQAKPDVEKIQGVWKFTDSWDDGKHTDVRATPIAIRFSKTQMEYGRLIDGKFRSEERPVRFKFKLDETKRPKHLDTELGPRVYLLEGNTFSIIGFSSDRTDRPRNKSDRPRTAPKKGAEGDGLWIGVFKRVDSS